MNRTERVARRIACAGVALLVAACGGGDNPPANFLLDASRLDRDAGSRASTDAPEDTTIFDERNDAFSSADASPASDAPVDGSAIGTVEHDAGEADQDATVASDERGASADAQTRDLDATDARTVETTQEDAASDVVIVDVTSDVVFPSDGTTESILRAQGSDCFDCAQRNGCLDPALQGGTCEGTLGDSPQACAMPLGFSSAPGETQVCLATLRGLLTTGCITALQETPCLCGATDPGACVAGAATPSGVLLPLYACDLEGPSSHMTTDFTNQTLGAGQANALVQCVAIFSCDCFP